MNTEIYGGNLKNYNGKRGGIYINYWGLGKEFDIILLYLAGKWDVGDGNIANREPQHVCSWEPKRYAWTVFKCEAKCREINEPSCEGWCYHISCVSFWVSLPHSRSPPSLALLPYCIVKSTCTAQGQTVLCDEC